MIPSVAGQMILVSSQEPSEETTDGTLREALWALPGLTADVITQIFGVRTHKRLRGKLHTMLEKLDHGHHVLRIYCKSLVARMYEKFGTFLRVEVCVNRLKDLGLNKGVENLPALRRNLVAVTDRLAAVEADLLKHLLRPEP